MSRYGRQSPLRYGWGVLIPLLCTAIAWPLRHVLGPASILMTYLLGVFLVASRFGRGASMTASAISAPLFAFYFASPIFSFAIADLENVVGLAVMMVVANLTSNLLEKAHAQAELAQRRERQANALFRLSRALSDAADSDELGRVASRYLSGQFSVQVELCCCDDQANLDGSDGLFASFSPVSAQQALRQGAAVLEGQRSYFPLQGSHGPLGVVMIGCPPQAALDAEDRALLDTFLNLIAASLERLVLAEKARQANLQAQAEAMRNALLSAISHDLRTPLTRISSAASALIDGGTSVPFGERLECYREVLEETQRMSELTGKILDMARMSSGELVLQRQWNDLEEIVGSALRRLDQALQQRPVRTQLAEGLPLLWIDAVLIEQVLVNLVENAIKYTPDGSPIDIHAEVVGDRVQLAVTDYGFGVPKAIEQQIFDKFFRGASEGQQSGVGLGLALCRAIVSAHDGRIGVSHPAGRGASFVIDLPLCEPPRIGCEACES